MNYKQAKEFHIANNDKRIYCARYDGRIWSAGRMVDVGDVIGYYLTEEEAKSACKDYELNDFDSEHLYTSVEICDSNEFDD